MVAPDHLTWHFYLQRLGTDWDRGQMAGVSQAACPVNDGPQSRPAEERLEGGAPGLVLCALFGP